MNHYSFAYAAIYCLHLFSHFAALEKPTQAEVEEMEVCEVVEMSPPSISAPFRLPDNCLDSGMVRPFPSRLRRRSWSRSILHASWECPSTVSGPS